uniref:Uncharacterized protein n=1 Tax=Salix viminalis TaxID=40686 RepID=A0A6N2NB90_SALVM
MNFDSITIHQGINNFPVKIKCIRFMVLDFPPLPFEDFLMKETGSRRLKFFIGSASESGASSL